MSQPHTFPSCAWTLARLDDWIDDGLSQADRAAVEAHLEECGPCRAEAESLRQLLAEAAQLPRALAPENDLWPAIEARLDEQPEVAPQPAIWQAPWWQQVAAALLFAALGALGAGGWGGTPEPQVALSGPGSDPDGVALAASPGDPTAVSGPAGAVRPASNPLAVDDGFVQVEAEYLRAKEALWLAVVEHREELSPVQLELVESHLAVIDAAVRDLRSALAKDPDDPRLRKMLLANHRRGLDLLWDLVHSDHA